MKTARRRRDFVNVRKRMLRLNLRRRRYERFSYCRWETLRDRIERYQRYKGYRIAESCGNCCHCRVMPEYDSETSYFCVYGLEEEPIFDGPGSRELRHIKGGKEAKLDQMEGCVQWERFWVPRSVSRNGVCPNWECLGTDADGNTLYPPLIQQSASDFFSPSYREKVSKLLRERSEKEG